MKNIKKIVASAFLVFALVALQSCAGTAKHCAAYAKHHSDNRPDYHETQ